MQVQPLGWEDPLEEGMATTAVFLPGESPWTEEYGGLLVTSVSFLPLIFSDNSVNLSEGSRLWRAHRELITG